MTKRLPTITENADPASPRRRELLRYGVHALGLIAGGRLLAGCRNDSDFYRLAANLHESDVPHLYIPEGFKARVIARTDEPVLPGGAFRWHAAPDGGAVFAADDGGWIYVSNSEMDDGAGGASAVRFDASGEIVDAYNVLSGTNRNCAGGPTPWNTWLSCEEVPNGHVWECDPFGRTAARELPALGTFMHEAVAVDPGSMQLYLTEDRSDGRLYRFTPAAIENDVPDLHDGLLEVAATTTPSGGPVSWHPVPDPAAVSVPTRRQASASTPFAGGEGAWYANRTIWFTTKQDNRVWAYDIDAQHLALVYDAATAANPVLTGVDNVTVSQSGTIYVAEDGGNMQIVAIDPEQRVFPVMQLSLHRGSEVTGPAFNPGGTRLYFSSQRGATGSSFSGVTYEISGPFA